MHVVKKGFGPEVHKEMTLKWSLTKFKAVEVLSQNFVILCYDKSDSALSVALISVCACIVFPSFCRSRPLPVGFTLPPVECQGWGLPGVA